MTVRRFFYIALLLIALSGLAMRISALVGGKAAYSPTGYDDGVYFSASALLVRGVLPYRDFVFVHPPGILYIVALVSWLPDAQDGFVAARMLGSVIGGVNIFLIGLIVARASHPAGGLVAALLYAGYPDAVVAERSVYLEPVLNLSCLIAAMLWLRQKPLPAGVAAAFACAVKFWGGIWVIAAIAAERGWRRTVRFIVAAAVAGLLALAPLALTAPRSFLTQTLVFQVSRPPDGVAGAVARLRQIADSGHRAATVLAVIALLVFIVKIRRLSEAERFFTVAMLLTIAAFLASSSYWSHYNSHLAASQCAVAGLGAAALLQALPRYRSAAAAAVFILIIGIDFPVWREMKRGIDAQSPELLAVAQTVRRNVPKDAPFFAFDPTWSLVMGRLPDCCDGAPPVVDSYGAMLLSAVTRGARHSDTNAAFRSGAPQPELRARLDASRFVLLGGRGHWQLDEPDRAWFTSRFRCVDVEAEELCLWTRRELLAAPAPLESQLLQFKEGWYGREGLPPVTWRWMSGHSLVKLPAIEGRARLELDIEVPLDVVPPPNVSIHLGGRELDRFVASEPTVKHAYHVDVHGDAPHSLTITADRTFVPAQRKGSSDRRELAIKVTRISWRPAAPAATSSRR